MINILFTSAGRRIELIQEFQKAKKNKNIKGKIICADMNELAPALYFADKSYIIPPIKDLNYIKELKNICKKENISLIIPTIDTELEVLANNINEFHSIGTDVLVSSPEIIKITQDKMETFKFFNSLGFKTPESYDKNTEYNGQFPCFIKPISGSSSVNAFKVNNKKELDFFKYYIGDYIIQELIIGEEYTVDIFCNFEGEPIYITPRIRISTRSGEVNKTKINYDPILVEQVKRIIKELKPKGPLTIQAIKNNQDGQYYFIEINARFGGGSPLSMMAGANSAGVLYDVLEGKEIHYLPNAAQEGLIFLRFDQSIIVREEDGHYEKI
ncbi:MAG TPA: ATP-grasp domain-containing protein [Bacilli bacterium]|nr:ATP-grasp domain-containing protein [Bacilli bacterium]